MEITVQKYGGSSLSTDQQVVEIAHRVRRAHRNGGALIVVVSARGDTTDDLVRAAAAVSAAPDPEETDKLLATGENESAALLAIALRALGVPAVSLTGPEAGMWATGRPGLGVVCAVHTATVQDWLGDGVVVVVAGFQAASTGGGVITLGRGGSDTSAVALAVAHDATRCEIYTDVAGVRRADPRLVGGSTQLAEIDAGVMAEMAFSGARVLHSRSVELAAACGVDITVGHFSGNGPCSTIIGGKSAMLQNVVGSSAAQAFEARAGVVAVTHDRAVAQLVVHTRGAFAERTAALLDAFARHQVPVDGLVRQTRADGSLEIACCVPESSATLALSAVGDALGPDGSAWVSRSVATVSVVGVGLLSRPGLTASAMRTLLELGIDVDCVSCTQARTTFLVDAARVGPAVTALYERFELGRTEIEALVPASA